MAGGMIALAALLALQDPAAALGGQPQVDPGLAGSSWSIVAVGSEPVNGSAYALSFTPAEMAGRAGCNSFTADYLATATDALTVGGVRTTRMACAPAVMAREQRLIAILIGNVRLSRPDANTLVLTGDEGAIRLRRVP